MIFFSRQNSTVYEIMISKIKCNKHKKKIYKNIYLPAFPAIFVFNQHKYLSSKEEKEIL